MDPPAALPGVELDAVVRALREAGAVFAYLHGSAASGTAREGSDVDVAAHFGGRDPASWTVGVPGVVDLLVLDRTPLELAGRVALRGRLLFDDDPAVRVRWEATTRKIYLDEQHRARRAVTDVAEGVLRAAAGRKHG